MSVDFVHHDSDSVSINIIHHSSHISQNNQKINQKQLKHLMSTFIKTSFIFYTAKFYSSASQLQLKVKKIADWIKYNIIYSKISQNFKAYKMKNIWLQSLIQYIMYQIKYMISFWYSFVWNIFWIWSFINVNLTNFLMLVFELLLVVSNYFESIS